MRGESARLRAGSVVICGARVNPPPARSCGRAADRLMLQVRVVTPRFFATLGIPVLRGRAFTDGDRLGSEAVAIISESAAARLFPNADPMGHQVTLGTRLGQGGIPAGGAVVGIVRDIHDRGPALPVRPTIYLAHGQFPIDYFSVAVKTAGNPSAPIPAWSTPATESTWR